MLRDHSFRKAHISIAVAIVVMVVGVGVFSRDPDDVEYQVIVWGSFTSAYLTLFLLYHREDRASTARRSGRKRHTE